MGSESAAVYGIHLGTTNSYVAVVDEYGKPVVIKNCIGDNFTPSVVHFDGPDRVVGSEAKNLSWIYSDTTAAMVKRWMGDPNWRFTYEAVDYRPEEISSYILRKLVSDAEKSLGTKISDVVITCPAYFGINEREATATAGKIAGLNVRDIIIEQNAAALAYSHYVSPTTKTHTALVYRLGGSTFDVAMVAIKSNEIECVAVDGDLNLGGRNWDDMVLNYLADQWKQETGSQDDPMDDPETAQDLFRKAEMVKTSLSTRDKVEVRVSHLGQCVKITVTREGFDQLTASILDRTVLLTSGMIEAAKAKGYPRFDQILLVGGATRMRQVAERLRGEFGMEPQMIDPDEIVAKGAAIFGMILANA